MKTATLDLIVNRINSFIEQMAESDTDTEGSHGEYVASMGYGECWDDLRFDEIDDAQIVQDLKNLRIRDSQAFRDLILENSSVEYVDMYLVENEVFSVTLGEIEHPLPDDIIADMAGLTGEELDYISRDTEAYLNGDNVYIDHGNDRMVLVLDLDTIRSLI